MRYQDKLITYLNLIKANFDVRSIIRKKQENKEVKSYYLSNHLAYLLFHDWDGFMHMGISKNGKYHKEDLLVPLNVINSYINQVNSRRVLEIGAGNGSNSVYLARKNKDVQFIAIDLSKHALKRHRAIKNFKQEIGDYHNLSRLENETFDVVFVIEALCHSVNKIIVLQEIYKKLKHGGFFVIFDGYGNKPSQELSVNERLAKKLTEKSMTVDNLDYINDFRKVIKKTGFKLIKEENLTQEVLPTMRRFEKLALVFYKNPLANRILRAFFSKDVLKNSIARLLLPTMLELRVGCYYLHVLQKP